jgi:hypothetical protein
LWKIFLRLHLLCRGLPMAPPHGFVPLQPIESCRCAGSRGDDGGLQSAPHRARVLQPGSPTPPAKSASTRSPRPSSKREREMGGWGAGQGGAVKQVGGGLDSPAGAVVRARETGAAKPSRRPDLAGWGRGSLVTCQGRRPELARQGRRSSPAGAVVRARKTGATKPSRRLDLAGRGRGSLVACQGRWPELACQGRRSSPAGAGVRARETGAARPSRRPDLTGRGRDSLIACQGRWLELAR